LSDAKYRIYVGWDSREDIAYQVCKQSILKYAKNKFDVEVIPLKQNELRENGLYWRDHDKLGSTEFTFTRFLVPELADFKGWALFVDCDFLFRLDVAHLFSLTQDRYAIMCAKHDYTPAEGVKMDGQAQLPYPRKNWSSMMLINCGHPSNKVLTKELVNNPDIDGKYLHRFSWLKDEEIGEVSHEWNWLVGWYKEPKDGVPRILHYTEGGPWFKEYERCEYAVDWLLMEKEYNRDTNKAKRHRLGEFDGFNESKQELIRDVLRYSVDPNNYYYSANLNTIEEKVNSMGEKIAAIDSDGGIGFASRGHEYDPYLVDFIHGSGGFISNWDRENTTNNTLVIRGLGGGSRKAIHHCWKQNRDFYAIDTGYFGNGKIKTIHRVTKNALQYLGPIYEREGDRAKRMGYKFKKFKPGSKILLVPPSNKVMELFGQPRPEEWVKQVKAELRQYTDRPIEVRLKPTRTERVNNKSIQAALQDDVHCVITYNSIAAVEALLEGKPAIVLGQNAASVVAETSLENVENPNTPSRDIMDAYMANLAYQQFTVNELRNGFAWRTLNESSELPIWDPTK
jgi:lipopolysaccharide biosynthesis glycosyltransferase